MSAPIPLRQDFDVSQLRSLARRTKDGPQARRLLALAAIYDGATRNEAAKIGGFGRQIIRDWVLRFNDRGPDALLNGKIDRVIAAGVRFGYVLADAGYGISAAFRQGLTARELAWAVGIPRHLKVYPADVRMIWPVAGRGRRRKRHVPDILSIAAEDMLADATWQNISWRTGTKGKLKARFAAIRVRIADGPPQRIRDKGQQH